MRRRFGQLINELAKKDDKIVLLVGDIGYGIFDEFRKNNPKKFFNFGICEQSIISCAAGMAIEGLKPWVYTITPFLIERPFSLNTSTAIPKPLFWISPAITGWNKFPKTKQETISVPPEIDAKWTSFFIFLYTYLNPSLDKGEPVEQIVLNFESL